jgi:hypothetical protein
MEISETSYNIATCPSCSADLPLHLAEETHQKLTLAACPPPINKALAPGASARL